MGRFDWDWSGEGPPEDAYSRVSEPERFAPLHSWALEVVARLQSEYEVTLDEAGIADADLERSPLSRPLMNSPNSDSLRHHHCLTDFPGLGVRRAAGSSTVPSCVGAASTNARAAFEGFADLLSDVVAGRFRESMYLDRSGDGRSTRQLWCGEHRRSSGGSYLPRDKAVQILDGKTEIFMEWMPWQPRPEGTDAH